MNDLRRHLFDAWLECWSVTALLTMALISGANVSTPAFELQDDSFNIHHDIN